MNYHGVDPLVGVNFWPLRATPLQQSLTSVTLFNMGMADVLLWSIVITSW